MVRALAPDTLDAVRNAFSRHQDAQAPMSTEILYTHAPPEAGAAPGMRRLMDQWLNPHRRPPPLTTRTAAAALRPAVEGWLGDRAILFQDVLMEKRPSHLPFPWHQDFPFWPVNAPLGLVVWAPLDAIDDLAGGLVLAARSHLAGVGPAVDLHTGGPQPMSEGSIPDMERYEVVRPQLVPGDVIVFHPLLWHMSPAHRAERRRRAWASTWLGAAARWSHARAPRHPLCRTVEDGAPVGEVPP